MTLNIYTVHVTQMSSSKFKTQDDLNMNMVVQINAHGLQFTKKVDEKHFLTLNFLAGVKVILV